MIHHFSLVEYWGVFYASVEGDSGQSLAAKLVIVPVSEYCWVFSSEDIEIRCSLHLHLTGFLHGAFHKQVFRKVEYQ